MAQSREPGLADWLHGPFPNRPRSLSQLSAPPPSTSPGALERNKKPRTEAGLLARNAADAGVRWPLYSSVPRQCTHLFFGIEFLTRAFDDFFSLILGQDAVLHGNVPRRLQFRVRR